MMSFVTDATVPVGSWPGAQKMCFGFVTVPSAPLPAAKAAASTSAHAADANERALLIDRYLPSRCPGLSASAENYARLASGARRTRGSSAE